MPNKSGTDDDFWDISKIVPVTKTFTRPARADTSAVTVDTGAPSPEDGEKIPRGIAPSQRPAAKPAVEYSPEGGLISKIKLVPWPAGFSFYSKFRRDAIKYFDIAGRECDYEYFFSYMPQYEQLSSAQLGYYFYFRSLVRDGTYPPVDSSYIFLYLYEIINLPDLIPPEKGAALLSDIWAAYRGKYRYLDKYIGEWLCDYCLIFRVSPPDIIKSFIGSVLPKVSLPEFYINPAEDNFSYEVIESLSSYDYKKSRFYPEHKTEFDTHIPAATVTAAKAIFTGDISAIPEAHSVRDSFSGAIACLDIKYKIEISCRSLHRSREIHQLLTLSGKAAENELRAVLGIKSRFQVSGLGENVISAISSYFDTYYPDRRPKKKKPSEDEEAPYMRYYAPRNVGEADVARAMRIERDAWETAALLEPETVAQSSAGSADDTHGARGSSFDEPARRTSEQNQGGGDGFEGLFASLGQTLTEAVAAALKGGFTAFCRKHNIMELDAQRRINELSGEYIGDMLIDSDFSVIEDYKDDALSIIKSLGKEQSDT